MLSVENPSAKNDTSPKELSKADRKIQQRQPVTPESDGSDWEILWPNVFFHTIWHIGSLYALYLIFTLQVSLKTTFWAWFVGWAALHGAIAGGHRLWAHNSYKAKLRLKVFYAFLQTMAFIHHIYDWAIDHRIHHKFVDTYADPYTSKRGLFYSHLGWLLISKHQSYLDKLKTMDMRDLEADPVVMFQKKYYFTLLPILALAFPTFVPYYFWNENLLNAFLVAGVLRTTLDMHMIFFVNSLAHYDGDRPYDKNINPAENIIVSILCIGEGYHNYHHTFPWDYRAAELNYWITNTSTALIDLMAKIGWAYNLKTTSDSMILKRALRTGDGSRQFDLDKLKAKNPQSNSEDSLDQIWGWGDEDMVQEHMKMAQFSYVKQEKNK